MPRLRRVQPAARAFDLALCSFWIRSRAAASSRSRGLTFTLGWMDSSLLDSAREFIVPAWPRATRETSSPQKTFGRTRVRARLCTGLRTTRVRHRPDVHFLTSLPAQQRAGFALPRSGKLPNLL